MPKAMILAAGRGERMRPLTDNCPKPLLKVAGKPLLQWHIEALVHAGFHDIVINHAYLGAQIEAFFGDGSGLNARLHYSAEETALETAGGIRQALHFFESEPFLVINGDIFCDWSRTNARNFIKSWDSQHLAQLVLVENPPHHPEGDFVLMGDQRVQTKPLNLSANDGHVLTFSGIGVYHPDLFADLPLGQAGQLAPLLRTAMAQGKVRGEFFDGLWMDIGTPQRLIEIDEVLKSMMAK
jgi:MurNAc alpha-1-phosphate uridylyltransferase